ncbi:MAG TPA: hypothetical protein DCE71_07325 [Parachlamydiales bacterium]|nr:hypothetical protein [Parachlamydiales bacterium]
MSIFSLSSTQEFRYLSKEEMTPLTKKEKEFLAKSDCPVCFEPLFESNFSIEEPSDLPIEDSVVTHCYPATQHAFHRRCVIIWLIENNNCAFCSQKASWGKISTWSEWIKGSAAVQCIQSLYNQTMESTVKKMAYGGGLIIFTGLFTNTPILPPFGFLLQSAGLYLARVYYRQESLDPLSERQAEQNRKVLIVQRINSTTLQAIIDLESQINDKKKKLQEKPSESLKETTKRLKQLLANQKKLSLDSSFKLQALSEESQRIERELFSIKTFDKILVTAQYAFVCYAFFLFCAALLNQKTDNLIEPLS